MLNSPIIFIDGATFIPGTDIAVVWGFTKIGSNYFDLYALFNVSIPGQAVPFFIMYYSMAIYDIKFSNGRVFVLGHERNLGMSLLQIY